MGNLKLFIYYILALIIILPALGSEIKTGDILLQPLDCWACRLIENEENSRFSHIGIAVREGEEVFVYEAYGKVQKVSLETFKKKTAKGKKLVVKRLVDHASLDFRALIVKLNKYLNYPYDKMFLWDNFIAGKEALYCSELVYKALLGNIDLYDLAPKKMHFDYKPELWDRYFRGQTPRGKLGISPEDFNLSSDFYLVQQL